MVPAAAVPAPVPTPDDVRRIASIEDPVVRNCAITAGYYRLALAFVARSPGWTNWLMFAVWASRQAGQTIRGEDLTANLQRHLSVPARWTAPVESIWRMLLRKGLLNPGTRLGRIVRAVPGPLDAIERASAALAIGNRMIFSEMGIAFAQWLATGRLEAGNSSLGSAFAHYEMAERTSDRNLRAQLRYLANLEVAYEEQVRAQELIVAAIDGPVLATRDLGRRVLVAAAPSLAPIALAAWLAGATLQPLARFARVLSRRFVTEALMTLAIPGKVLLLARDLEQTCPESLATLDTPELIALLAKWGGEAPSCAATDWSRLDDRMRYIARLFRVFHDDPVLSTPPFTAVQFAAIDCGLLPEGDLT